MSTNEIILIAIVVIVGVILVFGIYFGYTFITGRMSKKKSNATFNPENLVEEESLMNYMDEKKNIDFNNKKEEEIESFTDADVVEIVKNETAEKEEINPFGVDLTKTTREGRDYVKEEEERAKKKYFE